MQIAEVDSEGFDDKQSDGGFSTASAYVSARGDAKWERIMKKTNLITKEELLEWLNSHLYLQLHSLEQCGTGAVYCAILDKLHPNTFPFHKVKWQAIHEHEFVQNFKLV